VSCLEVDRDRADEVCDNTAPVVSGALSPLPNAAAGTGPGRRGAQRGDGETGSGVAELAWTITREARSRSRTAWTAPPRP
jgi:hypothetical protein